MSTAFRYSKRTSILYTTQYLIVKNRKYKNGIRCDNRSRKYLKKKKKKKQKSQINGTILIKKKIQLKTPKKYE